MLPDPQLPAVPAEWVRVFNAAVAAVGCPECGRTEPCRCYVPEDRRPDKTAIGLAAVLARIVDTLAERSSTP